MKPASRTARARGRRTTGGGAKKVLYTLRTAQRIGLKDTAKALRAKNTCKACGLGMGGQAGGMVNELGEFPAVCNKSVQAQSTDIQPPIPAAIFAHPLHELRELDGHELEHLGRLGTPIHKAQGERHFRPVDWDFAIDLAARQLRSTDPARSFFYSSGRASNEAGFLLQLFARLYGTNNVNNCSYYCHQATSVALGNTIGTGTSTIELDDLSACDLVFVVGANPASNHPRFIHKLQAVRQRGGHVVIINPAREPGLVRFAVPKSARSMLSGGTWIASEYLQPRIGSDIALFKGLAKAVLECGGEDREFLDQHVNDFAAFRADIDKCSWDGLTRACGVPRAAIERVARIYCGARRAVFAWGMGITHHLHGVDNIEALVNLALLRGMVGKRFAGLLPLRGHSNVQGIGTIGVKPVLPDEVFARMESEIGVRLPREPGYDTMAGMQAAARGEIDLALMMGGNLYGANPDAIWAEQALARIGFKIFLTTTLNRGHICGVGENESLILPVTARDEEWEPTTQESMFNYVRMSDGGINRLEQVRPESVIISQLAERVLDDCPVDFREFRAHRRIREAISRIVPGMQDLADIDVARREFHIRGRLLHTPQFHTANGRAVMPVVPLPAPAPEALAARRPWLLTTIRSEGQFNTIVYEHQDSYRGTEDRWVVLMNRSDMDARGLNDGDLVSLFSDHGSMECLKVATFDLPAGNLMAYFPEANVLTGTEVDPRSRTPAFKATRVSLETVA